jgi:hypothetical protein
LQETENWKMETGRTTGAVMLSQAPHRAVQGKAKHLSSCRKPNTVILRCAQDDIKRAEPSPDPVSIFKFPVSSF